MRELEANLFPHPYGLASRATAPGHRYTLEDNIGRGSFGVVNRVVDKETGLSYACKSIPKISKDKKYTTPHDLLKIRAEVDHMYLLGGSLDAVFLWVRKHPLLCKWGHRLLSFPFLSAERTTVPLWHTLNRVCCRSKDVFEDGKYVHMVMDLCTGGPLLGSKHDAIYDEQEVVTQMRSVMRFLAQCHDKVRPLKPCLLLACGDAHNPCPSPSSPTFHLLLPRPG